ncbi:TPA: hypothetical protein DIS61_03010 [Patescibacteria group bacterium]|nr:hypothetical protein [Patescibacteria group bacterium]
MCQGINPSISPATSANTGLAVSLYKTNIRVMIEIIPPIALGSLSQKAEFTPGGITPKKSSRLMAENKKIAKNCLDLTKFFIP